MAGGGQRSDYSPNATIITAGGNGARIRPKSIVTAISEIQQFFVIEKQGQEIPAEFLTLEGSLDFFRIGVTSGFKEGLFLVLLFPIFSFYILPFVLNSPDLFLKIIFDSFPYFVLIINTLLCIYISRYYVGNITRKAINSLFIGRAIMLVSKAFLVYIFYLIVFRMSTPEHVWEIAQHFGKNARGFYYGYLQILPQLMPVATEITIFLLVAAIVPYGSVYFLDHWRRYKIKKNVRIIGKT